MEAEFGRSSKGKETVMLSNFEYWKHRQNLNGTVVWRCTKSVLFHCKARITTRGKQVISGVPPAHTHEGNITCSQARIAVGEMKDKMSDIGATPSSSQGAVAQHLTDHVLMALPKRATLNRALQRHRKKLAAATNGGEGLPPLPVDHSFNIPASWADMVLFDSGPGTDRMIILGCDVLLDGLARADIWVADGTFSVVPSLFFQLYSIHFHFGEGINPVGLYCLLRNKTTESYTRLLTALHDLIPAAAPKKILVDFERAAITAFEAAYTSAIVTGCYFHLTQCVVRKVNEIGMKSSYENDDAIRASVRCLSALAFVPIPDVADAFDILAEDMPAHDHMNELVSFFEHTYIRGRRLRGRNANFGPALFSIETWNQRDSALDGIARTTNSVEGWHHGLQSLFHCHHPTVWTFLEGLKQDMSKQKAFLLQGAAGATHPQKKRYRDLKERVSRAVAGYGRTEVLTFLRAMAHLSHA